MNTDLEKLASLGVKVGLQEEEIVQEPIEELVDEIKQEAPPEPTVESSLQEEEEKDVEQNVHDEGYGEIVDLDAPEPKVEVDFVSAFNEKYGTSLKSEQEIVEAINKKPELEISEQAAKLDKWLKETGRPYSDWWITQIDYTKIPDNELAIQSLMNESKIDRETAVALFEDEYSKVEIDEDIMSEKEIAAAKRKNSAIDARIRQKAGLYRNEMESLKEKYAAPLDGWKAPNSETQNGIQKEESDKWNAEMQNTLKEIETLQIDLGNGKAFKFSAKDYIDTNSSKLLNIEKAFTEFYKEDGSGFDTKRFAKAAFLEKNFDRIAKSIFNHAYGQGAKSTVDAGKNLKYNVQGAKSGNVQPQKADWEKQAMETLKNVWGKNVMGVKI